MKKNILIIFKEKKEDRIFDFYLERKFSKEFNVNILYINQYFYLTTKNIIKKINEKIKLSKIDIVLFEGDHVSIIDKIFINQIDETVKKGLISFDDNYYHFENLILSTSMDFALVFDEYVKFQFNEIGVESHICLIEDDNSIFKNYNLEKKYDVLFFGRNKTDRKEIFNFLIENNIKVKTISKNEKAYYDNFELAKTINQSKIIICPTKTETTKRTNNPLYNFHYTFQNKGRVFMVGLSNSLALSEPFPAQDFIFKNKELPIFKSKEECLKIINKYLSNNIILKDDTKKFTSAVKLYVEQNSISQLKLFIDKIDKNKNKVKIKIPDWYHFLFFKKNLMLRYRYGFPKSLLFTYFDILINSKFKFLIFFVLLFPIVLLLFIMSFFKKKPKLENYFN
jgi:hypothetical protein